MDDGLGNWPLLALAIRAKAFREALVACCWYNDFLHFLVRGLRVSIISSNIFSLPTPFLYRCNVLHYHTRLSRLYLRAFKGQAQTPAFYILFSDVGYFDGPMTWQGGDIGIAAADECIALMLGVGMIGEAILQFPDAYASITDSAHLYVVTTTHTPVRIIASAASLLTEVPLELL